MARILMSPRVGPGSPPRLVDHPRTRRVARPLRQPRGCLQATP